MSNGTDVTDEKVWWASKGIWGSLIAVVFGAITFFTGHVFTPDDATFWTNHLVTLMNLVSGIVTVLGGLLAWYGRVNATQPINKTKVL